MTKRKHRIHVLKHGFVVLAQGETNINLPTCNGELNSTWTEVWVKLFQISPDHICKNIARYSVFTCIIIEFIQEEKTTYP